MLQHSSNSQSNHQGSNESHTQDSWKRYAESGLKGSTVGAAKSAFDDDKSFGNTFKNTVIGGAAGMAAEAVVDGVKYAHNAWSDARFTYDAATANEGDMAQLDGHCYVKESSESDSWREITSSEYQERLDSRDYDRKEYRHW